jgi:hypothetical protein
VLYSEYRESTSQSDNLTTDSVVLLRVDEICEGFLPLVLQSKLVSLQFLDGLERAIQAELEIASLVSSWSK